MSPYLNASSMQLVVLVTLVLTPSTPLKYFVVPVTVIYSLGFWGVYVLAEEKGVGLLEALVKFLTYALLSLSINLFYQLLRNKT
jgi:hypothetical protein